MTSRRLQLQISDEFACLLALYTRTGETSHMALLKGLRTRAIADGLVKPDGKPKTPGRTPARRRT